MTGSLFAKVSLPVKKKPECYLVKQSSGAGAESQPAPRGSDSLTNQNTTRSSRFDSLTNQNTRLTLVRITKQDRKHRDAVRSISAISASNRHETPLALSKNSKKLSFVVMIVLLIPYDPPSKQSSIMVPQYYRVLFFSLIFSLYFHLFVIYFKSTDWMHPVYKRRKTQSSDHIHLLDNVFQ